MLNGHENIYFIAIILNLFNHCHCYCGGCIEKENYGNNGILDFVFFLIE